MNVVHIQRRSFAGQFSIENLFAGLRREMEQAGCHVEPFTVPHHSKGLVRRLLNCWSARRQRADVYHITGDIHYVALFLPRQKTILTIHDCGALERLTGIKRWLMKLFWFDLPVRRAEYVTVISEETKRQLLRHVKVPDEKIRVIPNIVSPVFQPYPRAFNADCPRILHIGTKQNKNLSRLVQALRGMRCRLHIVGRLSDSQVKDLRSAGIEFSSAHDLSERQMYACYCDSDLVSFVSTYEGFGLPILEANAVGRPVVTSDASSMPEVAGKAACLVNPYDVNSIRDGIRRVIEEPQYRGQLVQEGFKNVGRFKGAAVSVEYVSLYHQIFPATERVPKCAQARPQPQHSPLPHEESPLGTA